MEHIPTSRRLTLEDAPLMQALEATCFSMPWTLEQCCAALKQKQFVAFGVFGTAELLGYISYYQIIDELEIVNLAVMPQWRRQGYGRLLMLTALQAGQKMGMHRVCLEVRRLNVAAIKLYESLGFTRTGCRKRYYCDTGEDALIYEKLF